LRVQIRMTEAGRDSHQQHTYTLRSRRNITNPEWKLWSDKAELLKHSCQATESALVQAQKARKYLMQPLPSKRRIEDRWQAFTHTRKELHNLRLKIENLRVQIRMTEAARDLHQQYLPLKRNIKYPEWELWNNKAESLKSSCQATESALVQAQKAPAYLKQPLPSDSFYGKRSLFFLHAPPLLRHGWKASYQSQEMIFSNGIMMQPPGETCDFHEFYRDPVPYRNAKNATSVPLALFVMKPPENYGTQHVEYISDKNDGVWYRSGFSPLIVWPGQKNPFIAH
jgi:hypothetical protein